MPTMPDKLPVQMVDDDYDSDSGNMKHILVKIQEAKKTKESAEKRKKARKLVTDAGKTFERKVAAEAEAFERNWRAKVEVHTACAGWH